MRILRRDDLDLEAYPEAELRDEDLRDLVDLLPAPERHMVSRKFFGSATLAEASAELGVARSTGKRLLSEGLATLLEWMEADPPVLPEELFYESVPLEERPFCTYVLADVGVCQQYVKAHGLCSFHLFQSETGMIPDVDWHARLVQGGRNIYDTLTQVEMDALVNGRYRGDGRRIDQYVNGLDPIGWDPLKGEA